MLGIGKTLVIDNLRSEILKLEGAKSINALKTDAGLGSIASAFPNATFPVGAVHEFLIANHEDKATTAGFVSAIISALMKSQGAVLWLSANPILSPLALAQFGVEPHRFLFITLKKEKDVFWVLDEALKCDSISSVVSELNHLDFTASRRLQLSVERSHVTGFVIRNCSRNINTTACVSRWRITSLPTESEKFPGVGFPKWKVELLRMRNGHTGSWTIQWKGGKVSVQEPASSTVYIQQKKVG